MNQAQIPVSLPQINVLENYPKNFQDFEKLKRSPFLEKYILATTEPTRDGIDYVECHYIMAKGDQTSDQRPSLPAHFSVFSIDGPAYFAFDQRTQPMPIYFIDTEMDQTLKVADNFEDFLSRLEYLPLILPQNEEWRDDFSDIKLWHYLAIASPNEAQTLLTYLENDFDKTSLLKWFLYYLEANFQNYASVILEAFNTQMTFFKTKLPKDLTDDITTLFNNNSDTAELFSKYAEKW